MSRKTRQAEIEQRRKTVAANLTGGLNYRDMATALGVSLGTVSKDVKIILARWRNEQVTAVDDWAQLEVRRLDRVLNGIWDKAIAGDLSAVDRVIKVMERRAKLLGLDKPERQEVSGLNGGPIETLEIGLTDEERARRIARILDAARARGNGLPSLSDTDPEGA